jgi:hypothetical protein
MADIVRRIPFELDSLQAGPGAAKYYLQDMAYNIAIGGIPFISGTNDAHPYIRELVDVRKQQFDNFAEPGEQSLQGWWLRSQSDFRGGAGILYQDPDNDNQFNVRFADSCGVTPWNAGSLELLVKGFGVSLTTTAPTSSKPVLVHGYASNSADWYWRTKGADMEFALPQGGFVGPVAYGGVGSDIVSLTGVGDRYYVANSTAVYTGLHTAAGAVAWNTASANTVIRWIKGRLMAGVDNKIYELVGAGPALPAAKFTHNDVAFKWIAFAEGPNAIYAAGNSTNAGSIYRFTLDTTGAVPTLAQPIVTAQMPLGETINDIYSYLGTFVGISTNRGFRVAEIGADGDLAYGPLLWDIEAGAITGYDRFLYVGVNNTHAPNPIDRTEKISGIYKVDLGKQIQEQSSNAVRYAYAKDVFWDLSTSTSISSRVTDVTSTATFLITAYVDSSATVASSTVSTDVFNKIDANFSPNPPLVEQGWVETGRIRFNTEEPKLYKFGSIRAQIDNGNLDVYSQVPNGTFQQSISYGPLSSPKTGDFSLTSINGAQNWLKLLYVLRRDTVTTNLGPKLNGWQLKALPGSIRQKFITQTVLCFDSEKDKASGRVGYEGYALERLQAFENLAQAGDSIVLQELYADTSTLVIIEGYQFVQSSPPGANSNGFGGYLTMKLRTVGDTVTTTV